MFTVNSSQSLLTSGQFIVIPGWIRLCIGFDLIASTVTSQVNGQISSTVITAKALSDPKWSLSTSTINVYSEQFTQFNIYSKPLNQIVWGNPGDILPWNLSHWVIDVGAKDTPYDKADIDSSIPTRFLAIQSDVTLKEAVSIYFK